jgi:LmbE family N-acetylglucosaminyl deacetylase
MSGQCDHHFSPADEQVWVMIHALSLYRQGAHKVDTREVGRELEGLAQARAIRLPARQALQGFLKSGGVEKVAGHAANMTRSWACVIWFVRHAPHMRFRHHQHDLFIPDETPADAALKRVTHLGIVSHQDDLEIAAYHGITECFHSGDRWFGGVVVTDGGGSPRKGPYADYTDEEMKRVRLIEQHKAAFVGEYGYMAQLGYPSDDVKYHRRADVAADVAYIVDQSQPEILYLHNPCDRHDTHVATFLRCLEGLRQLPKDRRPPKVYGCEVWRKLDWLLTDDKVMLRVDKHPHLLRPLLGVFDSQISGGKRYDLAEEGLRHANATYFDSHTTDKTSLLTFAMDLTPLVHDDHMDPEEYTLGYVRRLEADVQQRLRAYL